MSPDSDTSHGGFTKTQARIVTLAMVIIAVAAIYIAAKVQNLENLGFFADQMLTNIEQNTSSEE